MSIYDSVEGLGKHAIPLVRQQICGLLAASVLIWPVHLSMHVSQLAILSLKPEKICKSITHRGHHNLMQIPNTKQTPQRKGLPAALSAARRRASLYRWAMKTHGGNNTNNNVFRVWGAAPDRPDRRAYVVMGTTTNFRRFEENLHQPPQGFTMPVR